MEQTFLCIKPDGVQRGIVGDIISRFEKKGFKLVAMKMMVPTMELLEKHYEEHKGKGFYNSLVGFMSSSAVVAMVWEGKNIVAISRKVMGATKPLDAAPGTIRGDLGCDMGHNVIHGSDSIESAQREIALWFPEGVSEYKKDDEKWVYE